MKYYSYIDEIQYKKGDSFALLNLVGWCFKEDGSSILYTALINDQRIHLEPIMISREDALKKYKKDFKDTKVGFQIQLDLSSTIVDTIDIYADNHLLFHKDKKGLEKIKDKYPFEFHIDYFAFEKDQGKVHGWMFSLDEDPLYLTIVDEKKDSCKQDIHWAFRQDVGKKYNLDDRKFCCGFAISFDGSADQKYKLQVKSGNSTYIIDLVYGKSMKTLTKEYINNFNIKNVNKALLYLKENGIQGFMKRLKLGAGAKVISYPEWFEKHFPSSKELEKQRNHVFEYAPKISLIVATYNTPISFLKEMIASVLAQTYSNWQLCIADGSDTLDVEKYIQEHYQNNEKIVYRKLTSNLGIAGNMNAALELADGEYIGLYDHDDLLTCNALYEVIKTLQEKFYQFIYSDEDKYITDTKQLSDPHFKSDFNIDLMRSENYICHFCVVKKTLIDQVGSFDSKFDGAQDYDFMLRCIEAIDPQDIYHIPQILYHWRMHSLSTSSNPESKIYAFEAGKRAIEAHLKRMNLPAQVSMQEYLGLYRVKYELKSHPLVSILIPNKDHIDDLERCLNSIEEFSTYSNIEIILIENNSTEKATFDYYQAMQAKYSNIQVVYWKGEFNYSAINNYGAKFAKGDYLLLLNNDTQIINANCIEEMLSICQREDVGIVGARLCYEDDTIQHAGVIVGFGGIAGHCFVGNEKAAPGYFGRQISIQDLSAVTAACMLVKKSIFDQVHGLNEDLKVAFNDIDFCMKVRELGYLVVYNPFALLYHYESKSRGSEDSPEKVQRFNNEIQIFRNRWKDILEKGDPYYNPNLTYTNQSYTLCD